MNTCKDCSTNVTLKWYSGPTCIKCYQAARPRDKAHLSAYNKQRRKKNVNAFRAKDAIYRNKPGAKEKQLNRYLRYAYGITLADFKALSEKQGNTCAICKGVETRSRATRLLVDHCHTTGKIRGLLCHQCNVGIGHFKDSEELLLLAIQYLKVPV